MSKYILPAEFSPQAAIWLAWPHQKADWPDKFGPVPWVFAEIIRYVAAHQRVNLLVQNAAAEKDARATLKRAHANLKNVAFFTVKTDRGWMRDTGPIFVVPGVESLEFKHSTLGTKHSKVLLDFRSTGWAKYPNHTLDNQVRERINKTLKLPLIKPMHKGRHVVLEGGGIDVNGKGALLTTEEWLLSKVQVRNPGFTRDDYEEIFATYLGAPHTIWLGRGIMGDDTHGHVDDISRFVNADTIVTVTESNRKDDNHAPLADNLKRLKRTKFNVVELPMPRPLIFEKTRLPASYANFLITNKLVLMPTFNDPNDRVALALLAECFPGREVIGIHAVDLVWGFGTIHCMSMQEFA